MDKVFELMAVMQRLRGETDNDTLIALLQEAATKCDDLLVEGYLVQGLTEEAVQLILLALSSTMLMALGISGEGEASGHGFRDAIDLVLAPKV